MKITIEVSADVVKAIGMYATEIGGGKGMLALVGANQREALSNGLASIAEVALNQRAIDIAANYGLKLLTKCAWCNCVNIHGEWLRLRCATQQQEREYLTHGICPACKAKVEKEHVDAVLSGQASAGVSANGSCRSNTGRIEGLIGSGLLPVVSAELHEGVLSAQRSDACAAADALPAGV